MRVIRLDLQISLAFRIHRSENFVALYGLNEVHVPEGDVEEHGLINVLLIPRAFADKDLSAFVSELQ